MDKLARKESLDSIELNPAQDLSLEEEKKIARSFMGRVEWEMIVIGLTQFFVWLGVWGLVINGILPIWICLLYTSPSPRDLVLSRMPSSA